MSKTSALHLGMDEAGRGAVLGSMVLCGCVARGEDGVARLTELGLADSKELSAPRRRELAVKIRATAALIIVRRVPPWRVDEAVTGGNLNSLEIEEMVAIVKEADPCVVYVDALTSRPERFGRQLAGLLLPRVPRIVSENKADKIYTLVKAASIVAKVERDAEIARMNCIYGETGSGYPSDPKTRAILVEARRGGSRVCGDGCPCRPWRRRGQPKRHIRNKWGQPKRHIGNDLGQPKRHIGNDLGQPKRHIGNDLGQPQPQPQPQPRTACLKSVGRTACPELAEAEHGEWPVCVRKSWETLRKLKGGDGDTNAT